MLVDKYNPMEHIGVTEEIVKRWKDQISNNCDRKKYIYVTDILGRIQNIEICYNRNDYEYKIQELTNKISDFMAFQEAVYMLMTEGILMPVVSAYSTYPYKNNLSVRFIEEEKNSKATTTRDFTLPILPFEAFIFKPSLRNKN